MNTVVALFEDLAHVDCAVRALHSAHVSSDRIVVVSSVDDLLAAGVPPGEAEDYAAAVRAGASAVLVAAMPDDLERVAETLAGCQPIEVEHPRTHAGDPDPE